MECASFQSLPPVYIEVKRSVFLHIGIGDPNDARNYEAIAPYVLGYIDDIRPPYGVIIPQYEALPITVYPCPDSTVGIPALAPLNEIRVVCSGNYGPMIVGKPGGPAQNLVFNGKSVFFGLDQILTYMKTSDKPPTIDDVDVDFDLQNGDPILHPNYIGFTFIDFAPDNPLEENGDGTYFFVLNPKVKIIPSNIH